MTWQDNLRQLDEELAAGRLSADDYRRRRDELMAANDEESAPSSQPPEAHSARGSNPFPPAFRWETAPSEDTTQVMPTFGAPDADPSSERTQVVRGDRPTMPSDEDSDRTQVVEPGAPPSPHGAPAPPPAQGPPRQGAGDGQQYPGGGGYQPQPGWGQQDYAPPWASSDLPPMREPNAGWMLQGPEMFTSDTKPGATGRIVAVTLAVVVLLGIGVGAFFLFRPGGQAGAGAPTAPAPAQPPAGAAGQDTAPAAPPEPPGPPVADLPGEQRDTADITSFADVERLGYLTEGEVAAYRDAGAGEAIFRLAEDGDTSFIILAVRAQHPIAARDELHQLQLEFRLTEVPDAPPAVLAAGNNRVSSGPPVLRRAHYVSDDWVVRVQALGSEVATVDGMFGEVLGAQLDELPADG